MTARVFPLHLTPFEHYMFVDDSQRLPMTFVVQFEFSGKLIREAFEKAVERAIQRHPLLRAVVRRAKANVDCWVESSNPTVVNFGSLDAPLEFEETEYIDLRRAPGVRLWVRHDQEHAVLTGQFHHACCDGIGSYEFLGDILWYYAQETGSNLPEEALPQLDPLALRARSNATYDPEEFKLPNGRFRADYDELARFLFGRITPLHPLPKRRAERVANTFPGIRSHVFDRAEFKKLRLASLEAGQTMNDALIADLFTTIKQWNCERRSISRSQALCIMVPLNLRTSDLPALSAANCVTYAMLRRSGKGLRDEDLLRDSLREETTRLKQQRHASRFMNVAVVARRHPTILKTRLRMPRCIVTAILSNTGDPTKHFYARLPTKGGAVLCGNLVLEDISGVPPIRALTHLTTSIFTYRRSLKICIRCSPKLFTPDDTQQFLDQYIQVLRRRLS